MRPIPVRAKIRRLKAYAVYQPAHRIKLNQNESPYDLPEALKKKIVRQLARAKWNRYPPPFPEALKAKIGRIERWPAQGVVVGAGSNVLIQAIIIATAVDGRILTVEPTFSLYALEGELLGNKILRVDLDPEDFSLPIDKFLGAVRRHKPDLIVLPNPNAPTGNLFPEASLIKILQTAQCPVVVDEAYCHFARYTLRPRLQDYPNLILVRTLSKVFALGGVRVGYLMAEPGLAQEIQKVVLPFSVGVLPSLTAEAVLDHSSFVETRVREVVREREILFKALEKLPGLKVYPSEANYLLFRTQGPARVFRELIRRGILIRQIAGKGLDDTLRVTIGSPTENRAFLRALRAILSA